MKFASALTSYRTSPNGELCVKTVKPYLRDQCEEQVHKDTSERVESLMLGGAELPEQEFRNPDNNSITDFVEPLQVRVFGLADNGEGRAVVDEDSWRRPLSQNS